MEKIIYNTKLKKFFAGILVFMLLLYSMAPVVCAKTFMSFHPYQYIIDQGGIPSNADTDTNWSLEEWTITEQELIDLKRLYALAKDPDGDQEYQDSFNNFLYAYERRYSRI